MTSELFRKKAVEAERHQWLGSIRIGRPISFTIFTVGLVLLATMLLTFVVLAKVTRREKIVGILVPTSGVLNITAAESGLIQALNVKQGDVVLAGQPIAVIYTDRSTSKGESSTLVSLTLKQRQISIDNSKILAQRLHAEKKRSLVDQLENLAEETVQANGELSALRRRIVSANQTVERYKSLAGEGFVSIDLAQSKSNDLIDLEEKEQTQLRSLTSLHRNKIQTKLEAESSDIELATLLTQIARDQSLLDQESIENDSRHEVIVVAPHNGVISAVIFSSGQTIQAGQNIASLVDGPVTSGAILEARLFAPSRTAGFIKAGQRVWLRLESYPYSKFGMQSGSVIEVSQTPIIPQDLPAGQSNALLSASQSNGPLYQLTVKLDHQTTSAYGVEHSLKPGMTLDADVLQEERTVLQWILEPLQASAEKAKSLGQPDVVQ